jgi:hypothetical protein
VIQPITQVEVRCLAVSKHGLAGMSLGKWNWRSGFAEIGCPLPFSDLGHVLKGWRM